MGILEEYTPTYIIVFNESFLKISTNKLGGTEYYTYIYNELKN